MSKKQSAPERAMNSGATFDPNIQFDPDTHPFRIADDLLPLVKPMAAYVPDSENVRLHDERSIDGLIVALRQFGQTKNIVGWQGRIIAGNGLYLAAQALNGTHMAIADVSHMTRVEAIRYALADNRLAELSKWEYQSLAAQLNELKSAGAEIEDLGWAPHEMEPFLQAKWDPGAADELEEHGEGDGAGGGAGEGKDLSPGSDASRAKPIIVTPDQREVFEQAADRVKEICDDHAITEGRILELICADYLAGAGFSTDVGE